MLFHYEAIDAQGNERTGGIEASNKEAAIRALQNRGLILSSIAAEQEGSFLSRDLEIFNRVTSRDLVVLSRQIATLFGAQVQALQVFRLLAAQSENPSIQRHLTQVADDLQGGMSISQALNKHPDVFSSFYVSMVRTGEETGRLEQTFNFLADHIDRTHQLLSKARNALIYPAFVIFTFVVVISLMLTLVIPKLSSILEDTGGELPLYTQVVIGASNFLVNYGVFILVALIVLGFVAWRYSRTKEGATALSEIKLSFPYVGNLYHKLYISRLADSISTATSSGVPMVRSLEMAADVVGDATYRRIVEEALEDVRGGSSLSRAFAKHEQIPQIMAAMVKVGEETGELGNILDVIADFYRREVNNAVDNLVNLIEPLMVVVLGLGVAFLLASILVPIYNISTSF